MGGPDLVHAVPTFAESRRKIVDSADLYAVVSKINVQSSTIDKLAASEALLACAEFRPRRKREQEEEAAAHELAARCAGIRQHMRRNDAIDKAVELRARAEEDPSLLGRLIALSRSSDASKARWHAAEFALVGEALTSGDSVLISEAVRALHAQLDDGLPDAKLRSQAFAKAADSYLLHKADQRAIFDALVDCANLSDATTNPATRKTPAGLAACASGPKLNAWSGNIFLRCSVAFRCEIADHTIELR